MKLVAYEGPSPSRDVPGVGQMVRGVAVEVSEEVAERLLASPVFGEKGAKAPEKPAEAEGKG